MSVRDLYNYVVYDFWEKYGDPYSKELPLIDAGPWRIFGVVAVYLAFVKIIGPRFMKNREPYQLQKAILWYDWLHVIVNGACSLFAVYVTSGKSKHVNSICLHVDHKPQIKKKHEEINV